MKLAFRFFIEMDDFYDTYFAYKMGNFAIEITYFRTCISNFARTSISIFVCKNGIFAIDRLFTFLAGTFLILNF